jgi:hypothetical protein
MRSLDVASSLAQISDPAFEPQSLTDYKYLGSTVAGISGVLPPIRIRDTLRGILRNDGRIFSVNKHVRSRYSDLRGRA